MTVDQIVINKPVPYRESDAPRVSFEEFEQVFRWRQGEHTAFIGPTNSGKTTLATGLLKKQPYVTVLATKPKDDTMTRLAESEKYRILPKWKTLSARKWPRRMIWPPIHNLSLKTTERQSEVIHETLAAIYGEGGWCVYVDELWYIINILRLEFDVKAYLLQARSLGISFTCATQRPVAVPLEVYDQSTHLFFWRDNDERNLSRISGISWRSANQVRSLVANLDDHEFLYIRNSGEMYRSKASIGREVKK